MKHQNENPDSLLLIRRYIPEQVQSAIETDYYARVNTQADFARFARDPEFLRDPAPHVALYSDHGVIHVRDVASQILRVLDLVNGLLVPRRSPIALEFMRGYGVLTAYLHDIGMCDFSAFGRKMHPEFAAQEVFTPAFEPWLALIWEENWGNVAWRLRTLEDGGALGIDPSLVLREMLAMAICHSKSKVPVSLLNSRPALRQAMQVCLRSDLRSLYAHQASAPGPSQALGPREADPLALFPRGLPAGIVHPERLYDDFERDSFAWLVSDAEAVRALRVDVIDTLRALRCADALRQRGTVLKTSAGYQIFIDRTSANAVYALHGEEGGVYLLEVDNIAGAGEANLAGSELTRDGDLRVSFHRGAFSATGTARAIHRAAAIVNDVQADIIESFLRPTGEEDGVVKPASDMTILLECVNDNLEFAPLIASELVRLNPALAGRVRSVPSLEDIPPREMARYVDAPELDWEEAACREILRNMDGLGQRTGGMDPAEAFRDVKTLALQSGEVLAEAGASSGFVYVPMAPGLKGTPLGGYSPFTVHAWVALNTGAIRGGVRNATIVAERGLSVLAIPKEVYLKHWHHPYSLDDFTRLLAGRTDEAI